MSSVRTTTVPARQFMLFTADCHIKQRTWTNSTLLKGDSIAAFKTMIMETSKYGEPLDRLVIGGDLFDNNRPTSLDLEGIHTALSSFRHIYYIRGNHDNVNPSYLQALKPVQENPDMLIHDLNTYTAGDEMVIPDDFTPIDHVHIQGIHWDPSDSKFMEMFKNVISWWKAYERSYPEDTLYLVLHCAFKHLLSFEGAYTLDIDTIKNLCGNSRINFLVGHIHTRDTTVYNENGNYIHSPGALYPLSIDRMGQKHFASLINLVDGHIIDVPTDVRMYLKINIKDVDTDMATWLSKNVKWPTELRGRPAFVNLIVPEDYDKEIVLPTDPAYVFKVDRRLADIHRAAQQSGPVYSINDAIREELQNDANREMVVEMAEELLASDDPVGTLNEWLSFWGVRTVTC